MSYIEKRREVMMNKRPQGVTNKNKGSNAERLYAKKFRELGFELCQTARYASRLHDNAKIDLVHIPFNIQIKAGVQKNMNPAKELISMDTHIKMMFPNYDSVHMFPKLLIHHKQVGNGNKRTQNDSIVYMSLNQFREFESKVGKLYYTDIKRGKLEMNSEFKDLVYIPFDYFVDKIVCKLNSKNGDQ